MTRGSFIVPTLVIWMVAAAASIAGVAYWDAQREAEAVLREFEDDQVWLSEALAHALEYRLKSIEREARDAASVLATDSRELPGGLRLAPKAHAGRTRPASTTELRLEVVDAGGRPMIASMALRDLFSPLRSFERIDSRVLFRAPDGASIVTTDGSLVRSSALVTGFDRRSRSVQLTRHQAAELGLPARTAIAGLASLDFATFGDWRVAAVASAQSERDRATRAKWRDLLGVGVAGAMIIAFGGVALRTRTSELTLRHTLEIRAIESEQNERLVRADKLATLGALATGVAHEVSTPLGVIVTRAEQVIARARDDERMRRCGERIVSESDRINAVIRGFLELARGATPRLENADASALVESATRLVAHRFAHAEVVLRSRIEGVAPVVACDQRLFEQVLVNLLLNACEACSPGATVEIAIRGDGGHVDFVVVDEGVGIDAATATRATEPFFTTKPEGTGLGLAIAAEIVKHHRGTLELRPRTSRCGTEATVRLPTSIEGGDGDDLA